MGATKGLVLIGFKTLRVFRGAFLRRRKSSLSFTSLDLNKEEVQKDEFLSCWRLVSPNCGCDKDHLGFTPKQAGVTHGV